MRNGNPYGLSAFPLGGLGGAAHQRHANEPSSRSHPLTRYIATHLSIFKENIMVNHANKTRNETDNTYKTNRMQGLDRERELELLTERAHDFVCRQGDMKTNGTSEMDNRIQQLREQVSTNVHQVLEGQKTQSVQVQTRQIDARDTASTDQGNAVHNKTLQSNVNQAVVDVIGQREHEAIRVAFQDEADFHARIKRDSAQDQQNLDNTTRQTEQAVTAKMRDLKNIL